MPARLPAVAPNMPALLAPSAGSPAVAVSPGVTVLSKPSGDSESSGSEGKFMAEQLEADEEDQQEREAAASALFANPGS
eukprot:3905567-Alexandrium_andersonii.AAC.1